MRMYVKLALLAVAVAVLVCGGANVPSVSAQEDFIVTIGEDKVFWESNYHDAWLVGDAEISYAYSEGNEAVVGILAHPGEAGVAQAWIGVDFEWNLGEYTWDEVKSWPVKVTIDLSYLIGADCRGANGSANAAVGSNLSGWIDAIGSDTGSEEILRSGYYEDTYTSTVEGLDQLGRRVVLEAYCQAHSVGPIVAMSTTEAGFRHIRIEFADPAVLLLPGAGSNCNAMSSLKDWLENTKGLSGRVECFEYDSACWGTKESARRLGNYIRDFKGRMGVDKVYLVAHCFGGIVARYYIEERDGAENVEALVMVATPNHGVKGAGFLSYFFGRCHLFPGGSNRAFKDVDPSSQVLSALNDDWSAPPVRYHTIAGTADSAVHIMGDPPIIGQEPPNDCLVLVSSVELSNVTNEEVGDRHHPGPPCTGVSATALMQDTENVFPRIWDGLGLGGGGASASAVAEGEAQAGESNGGSDLRPLAGLFDGSLPPGDQASHQVSMDAAVGEAFFLLVWEEGPGIPSLQLTLRRPDASVVQPEDPGVQRSIGAGADEWRVESPASGTWTLEVAAGAGSIDADYTLAAMLETDVAFSLQADQPAYLVGETAQLTAALVQDTTPLTGATVVADVRGPDGSSDSMTLFDDGAHGDGASADGVYGNSLSLAQCGRYVVTASADIVLTEPTHREAVIAPVVSVPGDATMDLCLADDDGDGFDDDKELYVGTDPLDACPDDLTDDAWPPDMNNDTELTISDVILAFYGKILLPETYDRRSDFNADGELGISDVIIGYYGRMFASCTP